MPVYKAFISLTCFIAITANLYADKKWIPIESIMNDQNTKLDQNRSKTNPTNTWVDNIKTIRKLLDKSSNADESNPEHKSWYSLDGVENN
ncbi:MAG: hypothetical protein PHO27_06565 [Sulfuricurvum sp.]|nr:hypothetical protein [Sulfuricurvum sp.]